MTRSEARFGAAVAGMMAGCGVLVAAAMLVAFDGLIRFHVAGWALLLGAGVGAALAGAATAALFGCCGPRGLILALVGAVLATLSGGLIAGVILLPSRDLSLVAVALTLAALSPVLPVWMGLMGAVHWGARRLRRARRGGAE